MALDRGDACGTDLEGDQGFGLFDLLGKVSPLVKAGDVSMEDHGGSGPRRPSLWDDCWRLGGIVWWVSTGVMRVGQTSKETKALGCLICLERSAH